MQYTRSLALQEYGRPGPAAGVHSYETRVISRDPHGLHLKPSSRAGILAVGGDMSTYGSIVPESGGRGTGRTLTLPYLTLLALL